MTNTQPEAKPRQRRGLSNRRQQTVTLLVVFLLWAGIVLAAYWYATEYINSTIRDVQETNALHVQTLEDRLESLHQKMEELEWALETADDTLAESSVTQEELNHRISVLDQQLESLEESLQLLKDSVDG